MTNIPGNGEQPGFVLDPNSRFVVLAFTPDGKIAIAPNLITDEFEIIGILISGLGLMFGIIKDKISKKPSNIITLPPGSTLKKAPSL